MKRSISRILSVFLSALMVIGLLPVTALAAETYNLYIGNVQVTSDNAADILGDGTVSYDAGTKTLTLNNFSCDVPGRNSGDNDNFCNIYSGGGITINLVGDNTVMTQGHEGAASTAIYVSGTLTITGEGTLTLIGASTEASNNLCHGIYVSNLIIENTTVTTKGGYGTHPFGIRANRDVTIINSDVTAEGGEDCYYSYGIRAIRDVNIESSTVTARSGSVYSTESCAIYAGRSISITDSTVGAEAGYSPSNWSYGFQTKDGGVTIEGNSDVTVTSSDTGVYSYSGLVVEGSEFSVHVVDDESARYGVYCPDGSLRIDDSYVDISLDESESNGVGIDCQGINILSSQLDVTVGAMHDSSVQPSSSYNASIISQGDVFIEDDSYVALSSGDALTCQGLYAEERSVCVLNGSGLDITIGKSKTENSYGLYVGTLNLEDSLLDVWGVSDESVYYSGYGVYTTGDISVDAESTLSAWREGGKYNVAGLYCGGSLDIEGEVHAAAGEYKTDAETGDHGDSVGLILKNTETDVNGYLKAQGYSWAIANEEYMFQTLATITADAIRAGESYDGSDAQDVERDGKRATLEVTDTYKYVETNGWDSTYLITVTDGTADKDEATPGEIITITADEKDGYTFKEWEVVSGNVTLADNRDPETTFELMPGNVEIRAVYRQNSGGGGGSVPTKYDIDIADVGHGTATSSANKASKGTTVTITLTPDEGYEADSVTIKDKNGNEISFKDNGDGTYSFTMPASSVTVTATFKEKEHDCPSKGFTDVDPTEWYHEAIDYVVEKGLMKGIGDGKFAPDLNTKRAMIAMIVYRMEGEPEIEGESPFDDVAEDQWYTKAIIWGDREGILLGYGDGNFGPMDNVTREQLVAILHRYAKYKGYDVSAGDDAKALPYDDADKVSFWAVANVRWACAAGVMKGRTETTLAPTAEATRAEAALTFMLFCENVK